MSAPTGPAGDQPRVFTSPTGSFVLVLQPVPDDKFHLFVEEIEALSESLADLAEIGRRKLSEAPHA